MLPTVVNAGCSQCPKWKGGIDHQGDAAEGVFFNPRFHRLGRKVDGSHGTTNQSLLQEGLIRVELVVAAQLLVNVLHRSSRVGKERVIASMRKRGPPGDLGQEAKQL